MYGAYTQLQMHVNVSSTEVVNITFLYFVNSVW